MMKPGVVEQVHPRDRDAGAGRVEPAGSRERQRDDHAQAEALQREPGHADGRHGRGRRDEQAGAADRRTHPDDRAMP